MSDENTTVTATDQAERRAELVEGLKMLGRGRLDAAERIADLLLTPAAEMIELPVVAPGKAKAK